MPFKTLWNSFEEIQQEYLHHHHLFSLITWDLETTTPINGVSAHANTLAYLTKKNYELLTDSHTQNIIKQLLNGHYSLTPLQKRTLSMAQRNIRLLTLMPKEKVVAFSKLTAQAESTWQQARSEQNFSLFSPYLAEIIQYQREYIEAIGYTGHPYDALLDQYEEGLTVEKLDPFFNQLKACVIPLITQISALDPIECPWKGNLFSLEKQKDLSRWMATYLGFDFSKGAISESVHPFSLHFHPNDVRLTARYLQDDFLSSLLTTLHETGHALYEQDVDATIASTFLAHENSYSVHESQSRFYENCIGRSEGFWKPLYAKLIETFPEDLSDVSFDAFIRFLNQVQPSPIRVEADELTYPLHILIRYELEKEIFENPQLDINSLPQRWNEKYKYYLGIDIQNDSDGILQDVHWSGGSFGYFPTYALGSAYASQIHSAMSRVLDIDTLLKHQNLIPIHEFLKEKIHQFGASKTPQELLLNATHEPFNPEYYINYLTKKFSTLYCLPSKNTK